MKTNIIILILCSGRDSGVWLGTVNVCAEEPMVLLARVMTERSRACTKNMKELLCTRQQTRRTAASDYLQFHRQHSEAAHRSRQGPLSAGQAILSKGIRFHVGSWV